MFNLDMPEVEIFVCNLQQFLPEIRHRTFFPQKIPNKPSLY